MTDTTSARMIKPQGVLPFVITEGQAKAALDDWMKGLWFAPSGLTAYAKRGRKMSGIYSPFWTFDADTRSRYTGQRGDYYYETEWVEMEVNGRRQRVQRQVQKIRWSPASGRIARHFNDVLVLAASSLPRRFTDALAPWDLSHLNDYRPEYLSGFMAEGYTIALADGHQIAREEMTGVITMDARRDIGGNVQRVTSLETDYSAETFKHILLPVWTAAYRYSGKSYRFVVNGQSGRVQGERPYSVWKIAFAVLLALIAVAVFMAATQAYSQTPDLSAQTPQTILARPETRVLP
ncbi:primosomal protein N' (replication factor Y) - superfamily II helicase [Paracoccus cavernae]|uniref:primosomal protein N' (replication factor Y) - superfamily II helicase n=1 Tax=Paracoccus cavernae TaxID=1571207 RepID=UPI003643129B